MIHQCRTIVREWLAQIGLEFSQEKTKITHTLHEYEGEKPGFDFLGFNVRQYPVGKHHSGKNTNGESLGFKTFIKPSKEKAFAHYRKLAEIIDNHKASSQHVLVAKIAPIIIGWSNYF